MKPGSPPNLPDDEAPDPLLAALRQRLGDYGQAPPPAAWAAIRQRVAPPPLPQPWWRRPRRLLPLLALLLGLLATGTLPDRLGWHGTTTSPAGQQNSANQSANQLVSKPSETQHPLAARARPALAAVSIDKTTPVATRPAPGPSHQLPAALAAEEAGQGRHSAAASAASLLPAQNQPSANVAALSALRPSSALAGATHRLRHRAAGRTSKQTSDEQKLEATTLVPSRRSEAGLADARKTRLGQPLSSRIAKQPAGTKKLTGGESKNTASLKISQASPHTAAAATALSGSRHLPRTHQAVGRPADRKVLAKRPTPPASSRGSAAIAYSAANQALPTLSSPASYAPGLPADSLALKQARLLFPTLAQPALPAAQPDSTPPSPPVRRWSLLVVAGPTLSYRTLGAAPTLAAGHPDFARLERPALGLGAQAQVRRVLSGRWALAVGVGYHEYATRLALSLHDTTRVHQRDTYRLLTLPVQFTYALGAPHKRLAVGLLLGTEPGWYIGGRSTEGSDCGCKQQVYPADSAKTSPYRPLSLAFSLGLDLRYQVGGPASRWHLVVQPTGRYVATPFVRSDAVGFTRRQPWSLGLLTGFSWDLR